MTAPAREPVYGPTMIAHSKLAVGLEVLVDTSLGRARGVITEIPPATETSNGTPIFYYALFGAPEELRWARMTQILDLCPAGHFFRLDLFAAHHEYAIHRQTQNVS